MFARTLTHVVGSPPLVLLSSISVNLARHDQDGRRTSAFAPYLSYYSQEFSADNRTSFS